MNNKYFEFTHIYKKGPRIVEFATLLLIECLTNN